MQTCTCTHLGGLLRAQVRRGFRKIVRTLLHVACSNICMLYVACCGCTLHACTLSSCRYAVAFAKSELQALTPANAFVVRTSATHRQLRATYLFAEGSRAEPTQPHELLCHARITPRE